MSALAFDRGSIRGSVGGVISRGSIAQGAFDRSVPRGAAGAVRTAGRPARPARLLRTLLLGAVFIALVAGVLAAVLTPGAAAGDERPFVETSTVLVAEGENLWSIVSERGYERDPREVVSDIRELNGLSSSVVHPGQQLEVPAR